MDIIATLAAELSLKPAAVDAAVKLIDEGNTIPFIARYRKEATGGMDDVALRTLDDRLTYLRNLEQRKEDVILLIGAQGKLTPELEEEIRAATQLQRVEDLYKPYRKKRQTRAQKAREAGLEPLANMIIIQATSKGTPLDAAAVLRDARSGGGWLRHAGESACGCAGHRGGNSGGRPGERGRPAFVHGGHGRDRVRRRRRGRKDAL